MGFCNRMAVSAIALIALGGASSLRAQDAAVILLEGAAAGLGVSAQDVTPDGATVVGTSDGRVFRWTEAGGVEFLSPSEYFYTIKATVSDDGSVIASTLVDGTTFTVSAARWTQPGGWTFLGCLPAVPPTPDSPAQCSTAWDVSGDGSILVGLGWHGDTYDAEAFRWTQPTGMVGLGRPAQFSSRATAIAATGAVAGGFFEDEVGGYRRPVRWFGTGAPDFFLGANTLGEVGGISSTGGWVTGSALLLDENGYPLPPWTVQKAFLHSEATGFQYVLPTRDYDQYGSEWQAGGNGVADNGMVVGWSGSPGPWGGTLVPSLYCPGQERMFDFARLLAGAGAAIPFNVVIASAEAVTPDGRTVVGQAFDTETYLYVPYVARFAVDPCTPYVAPSLLEIPTLDVRGFAALTLGLAAAALIAIRRRRPSAR
jgi:hypothetical protein